MADDEPFKFHLYIDYFYIFVYLWYSELFDSIK